MKRAILFLCYDTDVHIVSSGYFGDMLLKYVKSLSYLNFVSCLTEGVLRLVVCESEEQYERFIHSKPEALDLQFALRCETVFCA